MTVGDEGAQHLAMQRFHTCTVLLSCCKTQVLLGKVACTMLVLTELLLAQRQGEIEA